MKTGLVSRLAPLVLVFCLPGMPLGAQGGKKLDVEFRAVLELYAAGGSALAAERFTENLPMSSKKDEVIHHRWRGRALELSDSRPRALLPIIGLYSKVHAQLLARQNTHLAARLLREILQLTEQYVERGGEEVPETASRMLAHVALNVRDLESLFLAIPLLRRAIELDENNTAAHLALITLLEKQGRLDAASDALEDLLKVDPDQAEARLRRAVIRARLGSPEAAEDLRAIIEGFFEPWMVLLAFQEGARMAVRSGDRERALALVEEALARFPGEESLRLFKAFLTRENVKSSDEQVAALAAGPWPREVSPRVRYNDWPNESSQAMRLRLADDITARLPVLAEALGGGSQP